MVNIQNKTLNVETVKCSRGVTGDFAQFYTNKLEMDKMNDLPHCIL